MMDRRAEKPRPSPMSMLNIGPAKQAVMDMLVRPFRAKVKFATMSCREFPHASIVIPIIVGGIRQTMPKKLSNLTS